MKHKLERALAYSTLALLVSLTLAMPASAAVDSSFWMHPTGGVCPVIDVVVHRGMEAVGNAALTIWDWMRGDA